MFTSLKKDNLSKYLYGEQFTFFLSHKCLPFIKDPLITCTNCRCWSQVRDPEDHFCHFWMTCASKNVPYVYKQLSFGNSKNTKHMPCSWLTYHPWCQTTALWRALVFWSRDTCHAGHAVGKAWSWDTNNQVLGLTWPPGMCGHILVLLFLGLYFLTWQVITGALRLLVQNTCDYMILQSNRIIGTCSIYSKSFFGILLVIRYLRAVVPNMG